MAARRLLIIMLLLLGISSVLAIALPNADRDRSDQGEPTVTGTTGTTGTTGSDTSAPDEDENAGDKAQVVKVEAGDDGVTDATVKLDSKDPTELKLKQGSRLVLTVESKTPSEVEIEGLGRIGFTDQYAPAVFDLVLPAEPGKYAVRAPGDEPAATIVVGR